MTSWTDNIVKIFVPSRLRSVVDAMIADLASPDAVAREEGDWMSFDRLLPVPNCFGDDGDDLRMTAMKAVSGRWWHALPPRPDGCTDLEAAYRSLSPRHDAAYARAAADFERTGVHNGHEWRMLRWGCKGHARGRPPTVHDVDEIDGTGAYGEYQGTVMVHWRFDTPDQAPTGYLAALARFCHRNGLGMRAWFSDEDGGTVVNPASDEMETRWTENDEVHVAMEEVPASTILANAGGIDVEVDEMATKRIAHRGMYGMW